MNPSSEWKHWSTCGRGITACDCHRPAVKQDYSVLSKKNIECILDEATRKTVGQDVLETTIKKGWQLCWSCAMHGGLQKSKTGTALDSWWEQKLRSTMHYMARYNLGSYWLDRHEDVCLKAMAKKQNILSDMLVTEWTMVLCCSGLAQREVGQFRFSFREKIAGLPFWFGLPDHF